MLRNHKLGQLDKTMSVFVFSIINKHTVILLGGGGKKHVLTSIGPVMAASIVCTLLELRSSLFNERRTSPEQNKKKRMPLIDMTTMRNDSFDSRLGKIQKNLSLTSTQNAKKIQ